MQKKIIALALAAVAGSAAAQTNVTVYGIVDVGQAYVKSSGSKDANGLDFTKGNQSAVGRLDSNSSYIGFKGVEDLGNGLKALFQYETGFAGDTGAFNTANRDTFVGLTGGFGTVVAGNLTHPLRAMGVKVELVPAAAGFGTTASLTGAIAGIKTGADERAANAIAYVSPAFSGFSATVAYINGENKTRDNQGNVTSKTDAGVTTVSATDKNVNAKQYQVAAQYENGPLFVGAGYHKSNNISLTAANGQLADNVVLSGLQADGVDARVYRLAAVYTLPTNTKLTALWDNTKVETGTYAASLGSSYFKRNAYSLGAAQSFGKNTVGLEYAKAAKIKTSGGNADDSSASLWTAIYTYELSKRTSVHARYSYLNNKDGVNYGFYNSPVSGNGASAGGFGTNYTGYMVGLRHAF